MTLESVKNDPKQPDPAPSTEPSPEPDVQRAGGPMGFMPNMPISAIQATYEMVIGARAAIRANEHWRGEDLEHMAMLIQLLKSMEPQYRTQLEMARQRQKEEEKQLREQLKQAGHVPNGEPIAAH